jgi:hypothetical protein
MGKEGLGPLTPSREKILAGKDKKTILEVLTAVIISSALLAFSGFATYYGDFQTDVWGFPLQFRSELCILAAVPGCETAIAWPIAALDFAFLVAVVYFAIRGLTNAAQRRFRALIAIVAGLGVTGTSYLVSISFADPNGATNLVGRGFPFPYYTRGIIGVTVSPLGFILDLLFWIFATHLIGFLVDSRGKTPLVGKRGAKMTALSFVGGVVLAALSSYISFEFGRSGFPLSYLTTWPPTPTPFDVYALDLDIWLWTAVSFAFLSLLGRLPSRRMEPSAYFLQP